MFKSEFMFKAVRVKKLGDFLNTCCFFCTRNILRNYTNSFLLLIINQLSANQNSIL